MSSIQSQSGHHREADVGGVASSPTSSRTFLLEGSNDGGVVTRGNYNRPSSPSARTTSTSRDNSSSNFRSLLRESIIPQRLNAPRERFLLFELLTIAFEYLPRPSLLAASQVSRAFHDATYGSECWGEYRAALYPCCHSHDVSTTTPGETTALTHHTTTTDREAFVETAQRHRIMQEFTPMLRYWVTSGVFVVAALLFWAHINIGTAFGSHGNVVFVLLSVMLTLVGAPIGFALYVTACLKIVQRLHKRWGLEMYRIRRTGGVQFYYRHLFSKTDQFFFMACFLVVLSSSVGVPILSARYDIVDEFLRDSTSKAFMQPNCSALTYDSPPTSILHETFYEVYSGHSANQDKKWYGFRRYSTADGFNPVRITPNSYWLHLPGPRNGIFLRGINAQFWDRWSSSGYKQYPLLNLDVTRQDYVYLRDSSADGIIAFGATSLPILFLNCIMYCKMRLNTRWQKRYVVIAVVESMFFLIGGGIAATTVGGMCLDPKSIFYPVCTFLPESNAIAMVVVGPISILLSFGLVFWLVT
eukprot:PhF_6_TR43339/c0_g1_i2/m.66323